MKVSAVAQNVLVVGEKKDFQKTKHLKLPLLWTITQDDVMLGLKLTTVLGVMTGMLDMTISQFLYGNRKIWGVQDE